MSIGVLPNRMFNSPIATVTMLILVAIMKRALVTHVLFMHTFLYVLFVHAQTYTHIYVSHMHYCLKVLGGLIH